MLAKQTAGSPRVDLAAAFSLQADAESSEQDVDFADLAMRAKRIGENESAPQLGALVELLKTASPTFAKMVQTNVQNTHAAECFALLAEAMQGSVNPRRFNSEIFSLIAVAKALDPQNDRARFVLARAFENDNCYARAMEECDAIDEGSPLKPKAKEFGKVCEEKKVRLVRQCTEKNAQNRTNLLRQGSSSPIKLLDGIGKGTAEKFGTEATTLFEASQMMEEGKVKLDGRSRTAAEKIAKCNKALFLSSSSSSSSPDLDQHLARVAKIFAQSCADQAEEVIMTWNAMASLSIHGTDAEWPEMVVRKASNIARAARDQQASILVVQECPGKDLERQGSANARRVTTEDTFTRELVSALDPRDKWQAVTIDVPCLKEEEDGRQKREEGGKRWWTRLAGGGGEEEGGKRIMVDHGEKHVIAWDSAVWKLCTDVTPAHIGRRAGATTAPESEWKGAGHGGEGSPFYRPPAFVVLERSDGWGGGAGAKGSPRRLALLSVHLKSGGKAETEEEVRKVASLGVRHCRDALQKGGGWRVGDAIVIIGDFNLEPGHSVFAEEGSLARQGFVFAGDRERPTNQAEFISGPARTYDGAWVWRYGGAEGEGVSGRVVEVGELEQVKRERAEIAKQIWRVLKETVPHTQTTKAVRAELLAEFEEGEGKVRPVKMAIYACAVRCPVLALAIYRTRHDQSVVPSPRLRHAVSSTGVADADLCNAIAVLTRICLGHPGCFRFLGEVFKRKVTRAWSDHKPVCVALAPLALGT